MDKWMGEWFINEWVELNGKFIVRYFGFIVRIEEVLRCFLD